PVAVRRPTLHPGELEQVDGVVRVIAELDLRDVAAPGEPEPDRRAHDPALVERGVPRALDPLCRRERAAERRTDVLAEHVGQVMALFGDVQRHANGLDHVRHGYLPSRTRSRSWKTCW